MISEEIYHYHFYFANITQPIIIEANNKATALNLLQLKIRQNIQYQNANLANIIIHSLVTGVSTKNMDGENYVWFKSIGWVSETDYKTIKQLHEKK